MPESNVNRKLAAILSADVVGYSRLMQDDDAATVATLQDYRAAIARVIERHKGRVVNAPGDNILAEFPSAIEAVECADEIQKVLQGRNLELPAERRMEFRIGINLGDVIEEEDGTIYGDGVNIAARMEALAEAGGICISSKVLDEVEGKLDFGFDFLGEQPVKNIDKPVRVYRVRGAAAGGIEAENAGMTWRRPAAIFAMAAVVLLAIGGVVVWLITQSPEPKTTAEAVDDVAPEIEVASVERMAFPLPEEPSIAVLPFDNLSGSAEHELIADGLSENIIAVLSQTRGMLVIARSSTFTYKGKPVQVQQVAEELGVRYVLEGSVQVSGQSIRVTAQLVDALTGSHIWSGRFDRLLSDVFAVQDEITLEVVTALQVELTEGAQAIVWRGGTENLEAWNHFQRGLVLHRRFTKEDNLRARALYEKAVAIDPNYALGWVYVGHTHQLAARFEWSSHPEADWRRVDEVGRKALALDPDFPDTYTLLAYHSALRGDTEQAIALARKGVELGPGNSVVNAIASELHLYSGRFDEALALMQRAMRLSPHSPAWYTSDLAAIQNNLGNHEEAIALAEQFIARRPQSPWGHPELLHALARLGRLEEAKRVLDDMLKLDPGFSIQDDHEYSIRCCALTAEMMEERESALRLAGVPEHPPRAGDDKPSIAVLPFENLSGDPEQDYFAKGIAEELITTIGRLPDIRVVSRGLSFDLAGRDPVTVARDLGVGFVLEGSVRKAGTVVRIDARLADIDGDHVWASQFDRDLTAASLFAIQDEIAVQVANRVAGSDGEINGRILERLHGTRAEDLSHYECYLRAFITAHSGSQQHHAESRDCLEAAVAADPTFADAWATLVWIYEFEHRLGFNPRPRPLERALEAGQKALSIDPNHPWVLRELAMIYFAQHDIARFFDAADRYLERNSDDAATLGWMGWPIAYAGQWERGIGMLQRAMELQPNHPTWYYVAFSLDKYRRGDYEGALMDARRMNMPEFWRDPFVTTIALAQLGRIDEARESLSSMLALHPPFADDPWGECRKWNWDEELIARILDGFEKAGLEIPPDPAL
jgi:adenylate cyclase